MELIFPDRFILVSPKGGPWYDPPDGLIDRYIEGTLTWEDNEELRRWKEKRLWLVCPCGVVRHVADVAKARVQRRYLRRNGVQRVCPLEPCGLCAIARETPTPGRILEEINERQPIDLILRTPIDAEPPSESPRDGGPGGEPKGARRRYPRDLGVIMNLYESAGLNRWSHPSCETDRWLAILDQAQAITLGRNSADPRETLAHVIWTPACSALDPVAEMLRRLIHDWASDIFAPECWFVGVVEDIATSEGVRTVRLPRLARFAARNKRLKGTPDSDPLTFSVPTHLVSQVGESGPYLAVVVCALSDSKDDLVPYRLLLHAVASFDHPIMVESNYEREVVLWLLDSNNRRPRRLEKPAVVDDHGHRPDVHLRDVRILIEVQGRDDPEYQERKSLSHKAMLEDSLYQGYVLVTFDPKREDFKTLALKLVEAEAQQRARATERGVSLRGADRRLSLDLGEPRSLDDEE